MVFADENRKSALESEPPSSGPPSVFPSMRVLGVPVSLVDLPRAAHQMCEWADSPDEARMIFVREVASLMLAVENPDLLRLHEEASLVVPDGTPLVWVGKLLGHGKEIGRVPGADLVDAVCRLSLQTGQSHYFYGGKAGVAKQMADVLLQKYPGLKVAGTFSPPMRNIGPDFVLSDEIMDEIKVISSSGADFIWVGVSSPKQEYWMAKAISVLDRGVCIGVGAAFDFHSGAVKRAPEWMRNNALEWLHRLLSEPTRLWRRYLVLVPLFGLKVSLELSGRALQRMRLP